MKKVKHDRRGKRKQEQKEAAECQADFLNEGCVLKCQR